MRITATVLTTSSPGPSWTSRSGLLAGVASAVAAAGALADDPRSGGLALQRGGGPLPGRHRSELTNEFGSQQKFVITATTAVNRTQTCTTNPRRRKTQRGPDLPGLLIRKP
jgi:hypothetical protein